jgi:hypothetical protein
MAGIACDVLFPEAVLFTGNQLLQWYCLLAGIVLISLQPGEGSVPECSYA